MFMHVFLKPVDPVFWHCLATSPSLPPSVLDPIQDLVITRLLYAMGFDLKAGATVVHKPLVNMLRKPAFVEGASGVVSGERSE